MFGLENVWVEKMTNPKIADNINEIPYGKESWEYRRAILDMVMQEIVELEQAIEAGKHIARHTWMINKIGCSVSYTEFKKKVKEKGFLNTLQEVIIIYD